jgi:hypothetical protein
LQEALLVERLYGQSLQMPATIEGQNGAVVKQVTRVRIEGCKPALYIRSSSGRASRCFSAEAAPQIPELRPGRPA